MYSQHRFLATRNSSAARPTFLFRLVLVAAAAAIALTGTIVQAASFIVTGAAEPGSATASCGAGPFCDTLREAINAALASADSTSTITFLPAIDGQEVDLAWCSNAATGSEFGPSSFFITGNKGIYVDGVIGLSKGITIARGSLTALGCAEFRLFDVDFGSQITLVGLTLKNGSARGGSSHYGGGALGAGGAIFNQGTVVLDRCTLLDNVAHGGDSGIVSLSYGGAGVGGDATSSAGGPPNGGPGVGQQPGTFGGGGSAYEAGATGGFGGGGGDGGTSGGNGGFGAGGGAYGSGSAGSGGFGGGNGGNSTAGNSGGGGGGMGGAIFNDAGTLIVTNSTFTANSAVGGSATGAGAGSGFGGAIFSYSGATTIQLVTLARNSVTAGSGNGGAADGASLYHVNDDAVNCTAGGNSCANPNGTLTLDVSILFYDSGATNNLVAKAINAGFSSWSCNNDILASQIGIDPTCTSHGDPLLSPLGHYGGTSQTMVPYQTSPAIGTASTFGIDNGDHDQRGVPRPPLTLSTVGAVVYDGDYLFANGFDY